MKFTTFAALSLTFAEASKLQKQVAPDAHQLLQTDKPPQSYSNIMMSVKSLEKAFEYHKNEEKLLNDINNELHEYQNMISQTENKKPAEEQNQQVATKQATKSAAKTEAKSEAKHEEKEKEQEKSDSKEDSKKPQDSQNAELDDDLSLDNILLQLSSEDTMEESLEELESLDKKRGGKKRGNGRKGKGKRKIKAPKNSTKSSNSSKKGKKKDKAAKLIQASSESKVDAHEGALDRLFNKFGDDQMLESQSLQLSQLDIMQKIKAADDAMNHVEALLAEAQQEALDLMDDNAGKQELTQLNQAASKFDFAAVIKKASELKEKYKSIASEVIPKIKALKEKVCGSDDDTPSMDLGL